MAKIDTEAVRLKYIKKKNNSMNADRALDSSTLKITVFVYHCYVHAKVCCEQAYLSQP